MGSRESGKRLWDAAHDGKAEKVGMLLLSHGAQSFINYQNEDRATPLFIASQEGHPSVTEKLIGARCNVDLQVEDGATPLHVAARRNHATVTKQLIEARCNVDLQDKQGWTALQHAQSCGHSGIVTLITGTKLFNAARDGDAATLSALLSTPGALSFINFQATESSFRLEHQQSTPLHAAVLNGHAGIAKQLIAARCNVDVQTKGGATAIYVAAELGHAVVTEQLTAAGCNIDLQMDDGATPLHVAALHGHASITKQLLAARCTIDIQEKNGFTALHIAAKKGQSSVTEQLLAARCNVDLEGGNGFTPLHMAALHGHQTVKKQLIAARCYVDPQRAREEEERAQAEGQRQQEEEQRRREEQRKKEEEEIAERRDAERRRVEEEAKEVEKGQQMKKEKEEAAELQHNLEALFQNAQMNRLGDLTDEALSEHLQQLFTEVDLDGSGEIDKQELNQLFLNLGVTLSERQLDMMVANVTGNANAEISVENFIIMIENILNDAKKKRAPKTAGGGEKAGSRDAGGGGGGGTAVAGKITAVAGKITAAVEIMTEKLDHLEDLAGSTVQGMQTAAGTAVTAVTAVAGKITAVTDVAGKITAVAGKVMAAVERMEEKMDGITLEHLEGLAGSAVQGMQTAAGATVNKMQEFAHTAKHTLKEMTGIHIVGDGSFDDSDGGHISKSKTALSLVSAARAEGGGGGERERERARMPLPPLEKRMPERMRKAMSLSVKAGFDLAKTRDDWDFALRFYTSTNQLRITENSDHRGEIRLDWNTFPSDIAQYTSYLQNREESGGSIAYLDVYEDQRGSASQQKMQQLYNQRLRLQGDAESEAKIAQLQPRVCSMEGLFAAAELGNVEVLKSLIRGYPLPTYDPDTGTYRPSDRTALPQPKTVLRETNQLSHKASKLQLNNAGCRVAGNAMDDLRQAAPFLFETGNTNITATRDLYETSYDVRDAYGKTPLHVASASGQHLAVELLIAEGCDVNAQDRIGQTPLHLACLGGHKDAIRVLLKHGARVDMVASDGRSVMHYCATGAHKDLTEWLLLDPEVKQHKFHLELEKKTSTSNETVLHFLGKSDASSTEKRRNVLNVAKIIIRTWSFQNNKKLELLLEAVDMKGRTPCHTSAASDSFELLQYLVSVGASTNIQACNGDLALHIAVRLCSVPSCNFLMSAGTDLSICNCDGDTPLHVAAAVGNLQIFKMIFQGSPPCTPPVFARFNSMGDSPLHVAARLCERENQKGDHPYHEMVQFAVLNRADPMLSNAHGLTPAMAAALGGNPRTVSFLLAFTTDDDGNSLATSQRNNEGENIFLFAARAGRCAVILQLAQENGVDIHCTSHTKVGAVSVAAHEGHVEALRVLVEVGCDALHRDILGRTCLHWAAKAGHAAVCEVLLEEMDISPDERDRGGCTPLHQAIVGKNDFDTIRCLVEAGANLEIKSKEGYTALQEAHFQLEYNKSTPGEIERSQKVLDYLTDARTWFYPRIYLRSHLESCLSSSLELVEEVLLHVVGSTLRDEYDQDGEYDVLQFDEDGDEYSQSSDFGDDVVEDIVKFRPPTAFSHISPRTGTPVEVPWLLPQRAITAIPYTKATPTFGPKHDALISTLGLMPGGSALDRQSLKLKQGDAFPRPLTVNLPPIRSSSAADNLYSTMERFGPCQGVDESWANLQGSRYWNLENRLKAVDSSMVSRLASQPLKESEHTFRPPRPQDSFRKQVKARASVKSDASCPTEAEGEGRGGKGKPLKAAMQPIQQPPLGAPKSYRGPKDVQPIADYNHILTFPPIDPREILQTAGGSLSIKERSEPFKKGKGVMGTVLAARKLLQGIRQEPAESLRISAGGVRSPQMTAQMGKRSTSVSPLEARETSSVHRGQQDGAIMPFERGATRSVNRPDATKSVHFDKTRGMSPVSLASPSSRRSRRSSRASARNQEVEVKLEDKTATIWWQNDMLPEEEVREWIRVTDRVRPNTAERERTQQALVKQRATTIRRIVEYHRAGHEEVDPFGRSLCFTSRYDPLTHTFKTLPSIPPAPVTLSEDEIKMKFPSKYSPPRRSKRESSPRD